MDKIQGQYNRALAYYHLTKNGSAAATCVKAMDRVSSLTDQDDNLIVLLRQLSSLYINIASTTLSTTTNTLTPRLAQQFGLPSISATSTDQFCMAIWTRLDNAGQCDSRIVGSYLLMTLKLAIPTLGRTIAETWLTRSDPSPDYLQVVEIYATRILPECNDLKSARLFVETHSILSDENKEALHHLIKCAEDKQVLQKEEEQKRQKVMLDKKRQQVARDLQGRRKKEMILRRQRRQTERSIKDVVQPEIPVPEQNLTIIKAWIHHLKVTGSVAIMVVFFALLSLLRGPRGYLTESLRTIMTKVWQLSRTGTKVNHI